MHGNTLMKSIYYAPLRERWCWIIPTIHVLTQLYIIPAQYILINLMHRYLVTIYVWVNCVIVGSGNGYACLVCQAITNTNADLLCTRHLCVKFREILIWWKVSFQGNIVGIISFITALITHHVTFMFSVGKTVQENMYSVLLRLTEIKKKGWDERYFI